jgi:hypothetical protein
VSLNWQYYFAGREELVDDVIGFFTSEATNPTFFDDIVSTCKRDSALSLVDIRHDNLLKLGYLSLQDFLLYQGNRIPQKGIPTPLVQRLLDQLCAQAVLVREPLLSAGDEALYSANKDLAQYLYERHLIRNLLFGFDYIAHNYRNAVTKIFVRSREGNEGTGTGFLFNVQSHDGSRRWSVIVTNKHVAEHEKHLQVLSHENEVKSWDRIHVSNNYDVAAIVLRDFWQIPAFHLYPDAQVLDDIMIVGYPPVPTTRESYQLFHRGEINAFVTDYWNNEFFLFSAKTSPGNSGGPVINNMGMVVGVVTQQLFEKGAFETTGQLPYFAAISSAKIIDFLNEEVTNDLT